MLAFGKTSGHVDIWSDVSAYPPKRLWVRLTFGQTLGWSDVPFQGIDVSEMLQNICSSTLNYLTTKKKKKKTSKKSIFKQLRAI